IPRATYGVEARARSTGEMPARRGRRRAACRTAGRAGRGRCTAAPRRGASIAATTARPATAANRPPSETRRISAGPDALRAPRGRGLHAAEDLHEDAVLA